MSTTVNKKIYIRANQVSTLVRVMKPLNETQKKQVNQIVSKFVNLLKDAHS